MSIVTVSTNANIEELGVPERCILLAIDSSERARDAFGWTLSNVYKTGDKLVIVNVSSPTSRDISNTYLNHSEAFDTLRTYGRHCITHNIPFEAMHCEGSDKAAMLAQVAQQSGASLLVVGNHNKGFSERLFLGSVSESLVHSTVLPVAIVKQPHVVPGMSMEGGPPRRKIGIAVDASDHARFAFDYTLANFSRDGDAIYVIAVRPASKNQREISAEVTAPVGLAGLVSGEELMETYAAAVRDSGFPTRIHLVHTLTHDRPAEAFARLALDLSLDVVVVGSRGRGAVARNVLGSFSDELIRSVRTNVVVAKMPPVTPEC